MTQWTYEQAGGTMIYPDGHTLARGYSGHGAGLNNPDMEAVANVGPIPAGTWRIDPVPLPEGHLGPVALALTPDGFDPHGRSLFRIHGDNAAMDRTASDGCIILSRPVRQAIAASGVTRLCVVRG